MSDPYGPQHTGDPVQDGLALLRYHTTGLDQMGMLNLRILGQILQGYEAAIETIDRAKQGQTPPPPFTKRTDAAMADLDPSPWVSNDPHGKYRVQGQIPPPPGFSTYYTFEPRPEYEQARDPYDRIRAGSANDATAYVEGFVEALTPAVTNSTHAYNLWNLLATDDGAMRQALEWAWRKRDEQRGSSSE